MLEICLFLNYLRLFALLRLLLNTNLVIFEYCQYFLKLFAFIQFLICHIGFFYELAFFIFCLNICVYFWFFYVYFNVKDLDFFLEIVYLLFYMEELGEFLYDFFGFLKADFLCILIF